MQTLLNIFKKQQLIRIVTTTINKSTQKQQKHLLNWFEYNEFNSNNYLKNRYSVTFKLLSATDPCEWDIFKLKYPRICYDHWIRGYLECMCIPNVIVVSQKWTYLRNNLYSNLNHKNTLHKTLLRKKIHTLMTTPKFWNCCHVFVWWIYENNVVKLNYCFEKNVLRLPSLKKHVHHKKLFQYFFFKK